MVGVSFQGAFAKEVFCMALIIDFVAGMMRG